MTTYTPKHERMRQWPEALPGNLETWASGHNTRDYENNGPNWALSGVPGALEHKCQVRCVGKNL